MGRRQRAFEHEPAATIDLMPGTAKRGIRHHSPGPIDEVRVKRLREPLPEAARLRCVTGRAGRFIGRSDSHRAPLLSVVLNLNLRRTAYKFEMKRSSFS